MYGSNVSSQGRIFIGNHLVNYEVEYNEWTTEEGIVYDKLMLYREDKEPMGFSLLQEAKRIIYGDVEALMIFPREERLIDAANCYHLYIRKDKEDSF